MASSRISSSKYFNRLQVNRLEVNNLKVNEEKQTNPEWLFSLIGDATYNASTNTLTLVDNDKLKLLGFTDRPYRQQIKFDDPLQELNFLFSKTNNDPDSFNKDPPNAVLVMNNKQVVYELVKFDTNTFHLKPLPNHSEYYNHKHYTGEISLFIDNALDLQYKYTSWFPNGASTLGGGSEISIYNLNGNNDDKLSIYLKSFINSS